MDTSILKWGIKKFFYKAWDNREKIAFVVGVVGTAYGTYKFVRSYENNKPVVEEYKSKKSELEADESRSDEEKRDETRKNAVAMVKGTAKNYSVATVVYLTSQGLITYAFCKQVSDIAKLDGLLTSTTLAFEALHAKFVEKYGEDEWRRLRYGDSVETVVDVDPETGVATETKTASFGVKNLDFSFVLDESVAIYDDYPGANLNTVMILLHSWNDRLHLNGGQLIFFRDVWESFYRNVDKFPADWANAGWVPYNKDGTHNDISFGINELEGPLDEATQLFVNGKTPKVRLVFNCVPNVYDAL